VLLRCAAELSDVVHEIITTPTLVRADRAIEDIGERRRLAGRLWSDAATHSEHERTGYIVCRLPVLWAVLADALEGVHEQEEEERQEEAGRGRRLLGRPGIMMVRGDYHLSLASDLRGLHIVPAQRENELLRESRFCA
jgi:hypothetical protein